MVVLQLDKDNGLDGYRICWMTSQELPSQSLVLLSDLSMLRDDLSGQEGGNIIKIWV